MRIRNIPHLVAQGCASFKRNGAMTTAAILVLVCCMLVLGSFYVIIDNLNKFIDEQTDEIKTINAYIDVSADDEEIASKRAALDELLAKPDSNIKSYVYVSKQQALEEMKARGDVLARVLDEYDPDESPLPVTFRISFKDFDKVQSLMRNLEEIFGADQIESTVDIYESVNSISSTVTVIGVGLMAVLLFIAVLIIMNTVKLTVFARRKDIAVMRYIGATGSFVVSPFIVEGILIGLVATVISCGLQYYLYTYVVSDIINSYGAISLAPAADYVPLIPLAFLGVGLFTGIIASAVSVKKHLNV